ncbi:hypothetical protein B0H17DRAFT_1333009, partial [Mycena rosella]
PPAPPTLPLRIFVSQARCTACTVADDQKIKVTLTAAPAHHLLNPRSLLQCSASGGSCSSCVGRHVCEPQVSNVLAVEQGHRLYNIYCITA